MKPGDLSINAIVIGSENPKNKGPEIRVPPCLLILLKLSDKYKKILIWKIPGAGNANVSPRCRRCRATVRFSCCSITDLKHRSRLPLLDRHFPLLAKMHFRCPITDRVLMPEFALSHRDFNFDLLLKAKTEEEMSTPAELQYKSRDSSTNEPSSHTVVPILASVIGKFKFFGILDGI